MADDQIHAKQSLRTGPDSVFRTVSSTDAGIDHELLCKMIEMHHELTERVRKLEEVLTKPRLEQLTRRVRRIEAMINLNTTDSHPAIDRSVLPKWANKTIAMDRMFQWWAFGCSANDLSALDNGKWGSSTLVSFDAIPIPHEYAPVWNGDWRDSLTNLEDQKV